MDRFIIAFSHYYFHSQRAVGHVKSNACLLARLRCFAGSKERFVYFGGKCISFISVISAGKFWISNVNTMNLTGILAFSDRFSFSSFVNRRSLEKRLNQET